MSDKSNKTPYVDRDISWMYFNHRILQEARRENIPLLERLSFLGIYSNNLDEFYRVRMATISRVAALTDKNVRHQKAKARELFSRIENLDAEYTREFTAAIRDVVAELAENGILMVNEEQLEDDQKHFVKCFFRNTVSGFISPVWLSRLHEFDKETDDRIYLAVVLSGPGRKTEYAIIELPTDTCGRFVTLPEKDGKAYVMYLDDVVRFSLPMIFPGMGFTDFKAYSFKFTKDAEMEIDNDLHVGPLEKVSKAVKSRQKGATLRVLFDEEMPENLITMIMSKLRLDSLDTVRPSGRYQNHKDYMGFPTKCRADLKYPAYRPAICPELKATDSLLQLISEKDRFIQVPYQSFDYVIRLLQEAAVSQNVKSIKITLYRLAKNSRIVEALICAAKNGKKVTAVVELLARFDESSNIHYAKRMRDAGINVVFGVEGLKVHSKIAHIGLRNGRDMAIVGTGNFHEGNAKVYTDYFLMTANPKIVKDVDAVFDFIKRPYKDPDYKHLLVSPLHIRDVFYSLIDDEIANARKGKEAWIKVKINHITDEGMVKKLYEASEAGVRIDLLVRGNCSIVTGMPGYSGNIHAAGIIDRYLEHARLFVFCAGGKKKTFLGSADWMPRNLDHRVEVITPVFDPDMKEDILYTIESGLADNTHARIVDGTGRNEMVGADSGLPPHRSQEDLHNHYAIRN